MDSDRGKTKEKAFPIVGIGASAGGLEAFEQFLRNTPADCGTAFVLIQHLDQADEGFLPELLQRFTRMKVVQVEDGIRVKPDCVYVSPPNRDLSILQETLHLHEPPAPGGLRLPIDFFFTYLADDQGERSIGVILSGTGMDGTLGLKAIKGKLGMTMVQDPASARHDGILKSAINAGLADYIGPAEILPAKLAAYVRHSFFGLRQGAAMEKNILGALEKIFTLLRTATGYDFSRYKKNTVRRRIERRMGIHEIDSVADYVRFAEENPQELQLLFKELLIGVTNFFRNPEAFQMLKEKAIPELLKSRTTGRTLRIWVPGCCTGEEAYSIAIILKEAFDEGGHQPQLKIRIFATDIDNDAIDRARQGRYQPSISADVSPERLARFFAKEESGYRVRREIREMVVFSIQNAIMDSPFTGLDILSCRNLLIYFTPELQKKLLPMFHRSLHRHGILFLGPSETIGGFTDLFAPLDVKWKIYTRRESAGPKGNSASAAV